MVLAALLYLLLASQRWELFELLFCALNPPLYLCLPLKKLFLHTKTNKK